MLLNSIIHSITVMEFIHFIGCVIIAVTIFVGGLYLFFKFLTWTSKVSGGP